MDLQRAKELDILLGLGLGLENLKELENHLDNHLHNIHRMRWCSRLRRQWLGFLRHIVQPIRSRGS